MPTRRWLINSLHPQGLVKDGDGTGLMLPAMRIPKGILLAEKAERIPMLTPTGTG